MSRTSRTFLSLAVLGAIFAPAAPAGAAVPDWVKPAVRYLDEQGVIDAETFRPNQAMRRRAFRRIMRAAFDGGYKRTAGKVTAGEVSAALVRVLGKQAIANHVEQAESPDGWRPRVPARFGSEIVAREMGLRHDRPTTEESSEASAGEPMRQADIAWAVWKAMTSPSTWGADALASFSLDTYDETRRAVVQFAVSLVGSPYVWGGEWHEATSSGYPYGQQNHGGFDCSGFVWFVLKESTSSWSPPGRPYAGWQLPERTSSDMAKAAPTKLGYKALRPGDLVFFSPDGGDALARSVYHAGIYLGRGWMIHSSGSRAGISIGSLGPGSWWNDQFAWGRRVIKT